MATYGQLENQLARMGRTVDNFRSANERLFTIVLSLGTQVVGGLVVGFTAYIERRWPMKDGSPFSIGPVPLSQFNAGVATVVSLALPPGIFQTAASHTAAAFWGNVTGTYGRAWGAAARARALAAKGKPAVAGAPYYATPTMYNTRDRAALAGDIDDDDEDEDEDEDDDDDEDLDEDERALFGRV